MDVLIKSFSVGAPNTPMTQLQASKLIPQCFDAAQKQQENLYSTTHGQCPSLLPWFSYSNPLDYTLGNGVATISGPPGTLGAAFPAQAPWQDTTFTRACCTRPDQTSPGYDPYVDAPCDLMACYESAPCQYILEQPLLPSDNQVVGCAPVGDAGPIFDSLLDGTPACTRLMNWAATASLNPPVKPFVPGDPTSGAVATTVDIASSFLAAFCATSSNQFYCSGLRQTGGGNNLLFPRIVPHVERPALLSFPNTNTVVFSATNVSNISFTNLQVYNSNPLLFTVTLSPEAMSLGPGQSFAVTVTQLTNTSFQYQYTLSNPQSVVIESINTNWSCALSSYSGPFPDGTNTLSTALWPDPPTCNVGDIPLTTSYVPYTSTNVTSTTPASPTPLYWTYTNIGRQPGFDNNECDSILTTNFFGGTCPGCPFAPYSPGAWPQGCLYTTTGWSGGCTNWFTYRMNLTTLQSCQAVGFPLFGFYFFDPSVWGSYANAQRQDWPLLGGFAAGQQFNYITNPLMQGTQVIALPLTSENMF